MIVWWNKVNCAKKKVSVYSHFQQYLRYIARQSLDFSKAKAEKVVTSSKRFSQERRWRREKRKMCLKQNLEAAKLCRVERQMTEEGIIFSIYTCLHLLFLHVLSLFLFAFDLTTSLGMKKNYSNCLDPFKAQFVIKLLFFRG